MQTRAFWQGTARAGALASLAFYCSAAPAAPLADQDLVLQPGWNAIFLEVQPADNTPDGVFGGLPLSSAWAWSPKTHSAEFTRDMTESLYTDSRWLAWFSSNRVEAMFNSLFRLQANQAYLVKLASPSSLAWRVTGVPAAPNRKWRANAFNLTGFPLDPAAPSLPGLSAFLAPSSAFAGQAVYRLQADGQWTLSPSPSAEPVKPGEAMWLHAAGEADYMGFLSVRTGDSSGLAYAGIALEKDLTLSNPGSALITVRVRNVAGPDGPVVYWRIEGTEILWDPLPDPLTFTLAPGESRTLRLAVRRELFTADVYETVIEVTGGGTRVRIPLTADKKMML